MRPRHSLPALGSSLLFVAVIALAGACGGDGAPPAEPAGAAPAEPLRAFRYELELQLTGLGALTDDPQVAAMGLPADIEIAATVSGAVVLPDRERSLTSVNLGFVSFDGLEAVHVGDAVWSRNPQTDWASGGAALGPFGALGVSPAALFGDALWQPDGSARAMLDAAPSERVTVDGRAARRVQLSGQELESAFADAGLIQALLADPARGDVSVEIWLLESGSPWRIVLRAASPEDPARPSAYADLQLSDHNSADLVIEPPA